MCSALVRDQVDIVGCCEANQVEDPPQSWNEAEQLSDQLQRMVSAEENTSCDPHCPPPKMVQGQSQTSQDPVPPSSRQF